MKLTEEERAILESVERGEWESVPHLADEKRRYQIAARAAQRKNKRVNIRMTEIDLLRFQKRAAEEGLPYQTFISSILHKYITGLSVAQDER
ncbi:MAG TPA: antitoxin [Candidatus Hydrogenedentes bacterium]|nr:antitoxin [Candidatus Hydrogenedentota bacterium]HRT63432.1 antitoxin [Candidatus Hydrogenedentota bacterium]